MQTIPSTQLVSTLCSADSITTDRLKATVGQVISATATNGTQTLSSPQKPYKGYRVRWNTCGRSQLGRILNVWAWGAMDIEWENGRRVHSVPTDILSTENWTLIPQF